MTEKKLYKRKLKAQQQMDDALFDIICAANLYAAAEREFYGRKKAIAKPNTAEVCEKQAYPFVADIATFPRTTMSARLCNCLSAVGCDMSSIRTILEFTKDKPRSYFYKIHSFGKGTMNELIRWTTKYATHDHTRLETEE